MQTRPIPSSGEALPVIGCGTYVGFDVGANGNKLKALADVIRTLRDAGGKVFDSSPMYGRAEAVLGDLLADAPDPGHTFIATKVWTRGRQAGITQMERSFALLKAKRIDLMQVHNLLDLEARVMRRQEHQDVSNVGRACHAAEWHEAGLLCHFGF